MQMDNLTVFDGHEAFYLAFNRLVHAESCLSELVDGQWDPIHFSPKRLSDMLASLSAVKLTALPELEECRSLLDRAKVCSEKFEQLHNFKKESGRLSSRVEELQKLTPKDGPRVNQSITE